MLRKLTVALLFVFFICLGAHAADVDMLMGNPSKATTDQTNKDNYLMNKDYFVLSYNDSKGTPNWVSWRLDTRYLGNLPRLPLFATDDTLPAAFTKITHHDYTNSGFDRGHMCPHADRSSDEEVDKSTFVMTNIVPQSHENNAGAWEQLEMYCRHLVQEEGKKLYIISGPLGIGGEGRNGSMNQIADGKVTVPQYTWKIIMVLDAKDDDNDIGRVDENTRLIGVLLPNNTKAPKDDWWDSRKSVKEIESLTGLTFFDSVPSEVIEPLKQKIDDKAVPVLQRPHE
ncbi:MAG: DNA/RNA non-specific endonuclease [Desulfomonilaceae bacterium]